MKVQELDFRAPLPEGDHFEGTRGLILRVRGANASWVFRYTSPTGRRREMGLGALKPTDDLVAERDGARVQARNARAKLIEGDDPIDIRAQKRDETRIEALRVRGLSLLRVLRNYHEQCVEPHVTPKYAREWTYRVEHDCPKWLLDTPVVDLKSLDILLAISETVVTQQRKDVLRQRIDQACEWLISREVVTANPAGVRRNTRRRWKSRFKGEPS